MSDSAPRLVVVGSGDTFAHFWRDLAETHGLELRRLSEPEPVRDSRTAAVLLVCAGREDRAVDLLHDAHRVGLDAPILVGAEADHRLAVELLQRGAADYFVLPSESGRLREEVGRRAAELEAAEPEAESPSAAEGYDFGRIVGEDPGLRDALDRLARAIPRARTTVLIVGETGTGKELMADALHTNGPRSNEPFVAVNCSAIPGNLLESELFGHEKGAFTDARSSKPGLFQVADGGTLFLDEIAALPLELQAKLLRVLESGEIRRVGGTRTETVDVRIVAAANVDLRDRVARGEFRDDLYYRLAVLPIRLPPLRERGRDVRTLARHFLSRFAEEYGVVPPDLTDDALRELDRHRWPGNVRELRNAVERALLLSNGRPVTPSHLALDETAPTRVDDRSEGDGLGERLPFPASLEELELAAVRRMIRRCAGNKSEAARQLEIPRSRLYRILDRGGDGDGERDGRDTNPAEPTGEL